MNGRIKCIPKGYPLGDITMEFLNRQLWELYLSPGNRDRWDMHIRSASRRGAHE